MEACSPGLNITQRQRLVTKQSLPFILVLDAHRVEVTPLRLPADRVASPELLAFLFPTSRREGLFYVANFACFWEQRKEENSGPRTPATPPPKCCSATWLPEWYIAPPHLIPRDCPVCAWVGASAGVGGGGGEWGVSHLSTTGGPKLLRQSVFTQ